MLIGAHVDMAAAISQASAVGADIAQVMFGDRSRGNAPPLLTPPH